MITGRLKRPSDQLENDIAPTLATPREDLMLPQEYLMGWAMAEVQCLVDSGDSNVFVWNAEHPNPRDDF